MKTNPSKTTPVTETGAPPASDSQPSTPQPSTLRSYGWHRDPLDHRDRYFLPGPETAPLIPAVMDLRPLCPPVYDQGALGSCTANAIAAAFRFEQHRQALADFNPSRLFIYYNEREKEGTVAQDAGAAIRDGIKSVVRQGVCPEDSWPYDPAVFAHQPSKAAYEAAKPHQALQYRRVPGTRHAMLRCLASGLPFVFGFTVFESFETDTVAQTGFMPMPKDTEAQLGGHAVMAVGYDTNTQRYLIQNSWGSQWGIEGRFWMPFAYLENGHLADDRWVISKVEAPFQQM